MALIWVREFTGGLDTRRMSEATSGGVLVRARNGHITRGGEFEQRAAFVPTYSLPNGTVGMAHVETGVVVFGHAAAPALPSGVLYQRLQHPNGLALVRVLSTDLYAGKLYAVGEFSDGSVHHFYDGQRVTDWFDGRARATFTLTGGGVTPAIAAVGSFTVSGGTNDPADRIEKLLVGGVDALGSPIQHTGDNGTTAAAIAAQINSYISTPNYAATATGSTVTVTASDAGTAANGRALIPDVQGSMTLVNVQSMAGGTALAASRVDNITVGGVPIIGGPVTWAGSLEATASAIAAAINAHTSSPNYTASSAGAAVSIAAAVTGTDANGRNVNFTLSSGMEINPSSANMANGATSSNAFQAGRFVKTIGQKVYSTSGPNMHFSGIKAPTRWTTDAVGAGFIDMSSESSGSEELVSLARYQNYIAVFASRIVQIWYADPDPNLNKQSQVLNNTGTGSPNSVTEFGDTDLFYLDESGLRSLRARDSSNAAATTDIGVPVDDLITAKLETLTENQRRQIVGLIEPKEGRFWLVMGDQIFIFSFFSGAKVSAWSTYDMSFIDASGNTVSFTASEAMVFNRRVHIRSGNTVFVYGGLADGRQHDATEAEAWLPYLDGDDPTRLKSFTGVDLAMRGLWHVSAAMDLTDESVEDVIGIFDTTTFNRDKNPFNNQATHVSLRFRSQGVGPHRLGSGVIHYESSEDAD